MSRENLNITRAAGGPIQNVPSFFFIHGNYYCYYYVIIAVADATRTTNVICNILLLGPGNEFLEGGPGLWPFGER